MSTTPGGAGGGAGGASQIDLRDHSPDGRVTVAICDDHPVFARGLAQLLEQEAPGFKVIGISNCGEEAERMVSEVEPDLLVMDLHLPGMSGIEAIRRIRTTTPSTRIVVLTMSDEEDELYAAVRAGACAYIVNHKDITAIAPRCATWPPATCASLPISPGAS